jgi:uncharacterized RDD family membrane protein YckC
MNMDGDNDYSTFTDRELAEALKFINASKFPLNHQNLVNEIERRVSLSAPSENAEGSACLGDGPDVERVSPYAGFWIRAGAMLVDATAYLPVTMTVLYMQSLSRYWYWYLLAPNFLVTLWFEAFLVMRFGGTPGKLAFGLQIRMANGDRVDGRAALLRCSWKLIYQVAMGIGAAVAASAFTDAQFEAMDWWQRAAALMANLPILALILLQLYKPWLLAEIICLLANKKKRALHDLIAGTVVVRSGHLEELATSTPI